VQRVTRPIFLKLSDQKDAAIRSSYFLNVPKQLHLKRSFDKIHKVIKRIYFITFCLSGILLI